METKTCSQCGKNLPIEEFHWRNKMKGTRRANCKNCQNTYMRTHYHKKKETINEIKAKTGCAKCGEKRPYCLDFHHIDPMTKENTIARMSSNSYNIANILTEIDKCICLCSNCHREFHYLLERDNTLTIQSYIQ